MPETYDNTKVDFLDLYGIYWFLRQALTSPKKWKIWFQISNKQLGNSLRYGMFSFKYIAPFYR